MNIKKILVVLVISLFFLSTTVGIFKASVEQIKNFDKKGYQTIEDTIFFSDPELMEQNGYIKIRVDNTDHFLENPNFPRLPAYKKTYEFPFGTKIYDVEISHSEKEIKIIEKEIINVPEPQPYVVVSKKVEKTEKNLINEQENTDRKEPYPNKMSEYDITVGRNKNMEKTLFLTITIYPVQSYSQKNEIKYIKQAEVEIEYNKPDISFSNPEEDLLIITATAYEDELQALVTHKENHGIETKLVTTDEIDTNGIDLAEKIKRYIYEEDIPYVLLVGGYRSFLGFNKPELQLPLRWIDYTAYEPGMVSDLYYADTTYYDENTGEYKFDTWDTNGNGKFGEDSWTAYDDLDMRPDVTVGRLACRSEEEATIVVNKIINYENTDKTGSDWFNKIITATGDDFQDISDWNIYWDTDGFSGEYTIHAQSKNHLGTTGNEHTITVTINHGMESNITFTEKDHEITDRKYPYNSPIAFITVPSNGNILGNSDVEVETPTNAYGGEYWTSIDYVDKVIGIKGKSYDPRTQGGENPDRPFTEAKVWITKGGAIVEEWNVNSSCWFEGEHQAQTALDYFPNSMEKIKVWTSNGELHGTEPSILEPAASPKVDGTKSLTEEINKGSGFFYACGHACAISWADHYPGIPGGRALSDVAGLKVIRFPTSLASLTDVFPINNINNGKKLPVAVISGCHPAALDTSLLKALYDFNQVFSGAEYGKFSPECLAWWLTRLENGGSIATMGPTALGFGAQGEYWKVGAGTRFWSDGLFKIYNEQNEDIIGNLFMQTQSYYMENYCSPPTGVSKQTILEHVLLGDPTLKIGGYPSASISFSPNKKQKEIKAEILPEKIELKSEKKFTDLYDQDSSSFSGIDLKITTNPLTDKKPETFISTDDGAYIAGYAREVNTHAGGAFQNGFAVSDGGTIWTELIMTNGDDEIVHQDISYTGVEKKAVGVDYNAVGTNFDIILMDNILNPDSWDVLTYYIPSGDIFDFGRNGVGAAGGYEDGEFAYTAVFPANTTEAYDRLEQVPVFTSSLSNYIMWFPSLEHSKNFDMEAIQSTGGSIFAFENPDGGYIGHVEIVGGQYGIDIIVDQELTFTNPDIDAIPNMGIVVYQEGNTIKSVTFDGLAWETTQTVTMDAEKPEIVANSDGSFDCYYVKNGEIYKKHGTPGGVIPIDWGDEEKVSGITNYKIGDKFDACEGGIIYPGTDDDLYFNGELGDIESFEITNIEGLGENRIKATIKNTGTTSISKDWSINVEGVIPYLLPEIFRGRVFSGEETTGSITNLGVGESIEIESNQIKGILWCNFVVNVGSEIAKEDGFLAWNQILVKHERE